MQQLVIETERAWQALGIIQYGVTPAELKSLQFRRSLYIVKDIEAGKILERDHVRAIRPGLGLPPKYLDTIIGMQVKTNIKRGTAISWDQFSV